jgi:hypothetical protein
MNPELKILQCEAMKIIHFMLPLFFAACNFNQMAEINESETAGFNGSFEDVQNGIPTNWYIYQPSNDKVNAEIVFDSINPPNGKQSLKFEIKNCSPIGGWHSPGIFTEVDCENGKTYQVSFWLKKQGCTHMIRMDCWKGGTEDINHPKKWITNTDTIPTWKKFDYEFTFNKDLNRFRFELNILTPGTLWIDDVRIVKK